MATDPVSFMNAADDFLAKVEASKLVAKNELETIRKGLVQDLRRETKATVNSLQTATVGAAKILVPNSDNLRKINLSTERSRKRMSSFRLSYLDRTQVSNLASDGSTLPEDKAKFIRHSRRLARHAREFLTQIKELEPTLQEEVDATLLQLEDNDLDLLKLEVKSFTRMRETMLRGVQGRKERGQVLKEIDDFDINRSLFNLSLLEHPDAVVRDLLATASERMGSAVTEKISEIPKAAHVFVGLGPDAMSKTGPAGRTAEIAFNLFDTKTLNDKYKNAPGRQASPGGWRGLGMGFNTKEWYLPVPPSLVTGAAGEELLALAAVKRATLLGGAESVAIKDAAKDAAKDEGKPAKKPRAPRKKEWKESKTLPEATKQLQKLTTRSPGSVSVLGEQSDPKRTLAAVNEIGKAHVDLLNTYPGLSKYKSGKSKALYSLELSDEVRQWAPDGKGRIVAGQYTTTSTGSKRIVRIATGNKATKDVIWNRAVNATLPVRKSDPEGATVWGISKGLTDTYRHEFGHAVHYRVPAAKWKEWEKIYNSHPRDWWKANVSEYGNTNLKEAFAESFSYYTNPRKNSSTPSLPKEIADFLRSILLA